MQKFHNETWEFVNPFSTMAAKTAGYCSYPHRDFDLVFANSISMIVRNISQNYFSKMATKIAAIDEKNTLATLATTIVISTWLFTNSISLMAHTSLRKYLSRMDIIYRKSISRPLLLSWWWFQIWLSANSILEWCVTFFEKILTKMAVICDYTASSCRPLPTLQIFSGEFLRLISSKWYAGCH